MHKSPRIQSKILKIDSICFFSGCIESNQHLFSSHCFKSSQKHQQHIGQAMKVDPNGNFFQNVRSYSLKNNQKHSQMKTFAKNKLFLIKHQIKRKVPALKLSVLDEIFEEKKHKLKFYLQLFQKNAGNAICYMFDCATMHQKYQIANIFIKIFKQMNQTNKFSSEKIVYSFMEHQVMLLNEEILSQIDKLELSQLINEKINESAQPKNDKLNQQDVIAKESSFGQKEKEIQTIDRQKKERKLTFCQIQFIHIDQRDRQIMVSVEIPITFNEKMVDQSNGDLNEDKENDKNHLNIEGVQQSENIIQNEKEKEKGVKIEEGEMQINEEAQDDEAIDVDCEQDEQIFSNLQKKSSQLSMIRDSFANKLQSNSLKESVNKKVVKYFLMNGLGYHCIPDYLKSYLPTSLIYHNKFVQIVRHFLGKIRKFLQDNFGLVQQQTKTQMFKSYLFVIKYYIKILNAKNIQTLQNLFQLIYHLDCTIPSKTDILSLYQQLKHQATQAQVRHNRKFKSWINTFPDDQVSTPEKEEQERSNHLSSQSKMLKEQQPLSAQIKNSKQSQ